jgi:hypothetical protein
MYNVETVESLQSYGSRLHQQHARVVTTSTMPRRSAMRALVRRVRRSS